MKSNFYLGSDEGAISPETYGELCRLGEDYGRDSVSGRRQGCDNNKEDFDVHTLLPLSSSPFYMTTVTVRPRRRCFVCKVSTSYYCKRCSNDTSSHGFVAICSPFDSNEKTCYWKHINAPLVGEAAAVTSGLTSSPCCSSPKATKPYSPSSVVSLKRALEPDDLDVEETTRKCRRVTASPKIGRLIGSLPMAISQERKKVMGEVFSSLAKEMSIS